MMNSETRQARDFYANFQLLDRDINRIQRTNIRMRNFFLLLLTQLFLLTLLFSTSWMN